MEDNGGRSRDCAIALGHLGVLAEALSGGVGDWEERLIEGDESERAQQAAHIRGLLARAAEELDELAADLAGEADRTGAGADDDGHHLEMLRRAHLHEEEEDLAVPEARWQDAALADEPEDEFEAEADLDEAEFERRHRRR